jgi:hypothetical protein
MYLVGYFKKSTISANSSFASSAPATSLKVTPVLRLTLTLLPNFPKLINLKRSSIKSFRPGIYMVIVKVVKRAPKNKTQNKTWSRTGT